MAKIASLYRLVNSVIEFRNASTHGEDSPLGLNMSIRVVKRKSRSVGRDRSIIDKTYCNYRIA